jgi:hypothetical protein
MALILGVLSQFISGNSIPGIILGILVGSAWLHSGIKSFQFWFLLVLVVAMFILIAYFRGVTWNSIIHFREATASLQRLQVDFKQLTNIDFSVVNHPGIMNEV